MAESAFLPAHSAESELWMDSPERRGPPVQLSFLCPCGKRIALKALGCCRSCYDRRHHSLRFFGGLRERVMERDRFRCHGCGQRSALVVHHRDRVRLHPNDPVLTSSSTPFECSPLLCFSKSQLKLQCEGVLPLLALPDAHHAGTHWCFGRPGGIQSVSGYHA
jgi:hypothetical protein